MERIYQILYFTQVIINYSTEIFKADFYLFLAHWRTTTEISIPVFLQLDLSPPIFQTDSNLEQIKQTIIFCST